MAKFRALGQRFISWCARHKIFTAIVVAALILVIPARSVFAIGFMDFAQNPLDATALILAGIIQNITAALGLVTLRIIELIVIPVLGYNGFYNSNITNLGWSLVRDVVNMFVVVVLLVIAIMTILGISKANWAQQLPRLFIAIVLVNFSKLICGFLIDVSQVIMFTFVNAIVSIAAGNFASMLGLSTFGQFGSDFLEEQNAAGDGVQSFMFLGAAYFQFVIYLAILAVMFLLAIAFIWRIVILWILIIMSPLAFFMIGIKDIFPKANSSYSEWWGKFGSALMFGPMMTFFLWLALAASAGSTLSQTEDFPMPEESNSLDLPLQMFSLDNFLGMFLALAILIAGMQQASSSAKAMEGFASSMLSPQKGKDMATWLAKSPFKAAGGFKKERAWANERAQKGAAAAAVVAPGLTKGAGNAMSWLGRQGSRMPLLGGTGNALAAVGGNIVKGVKDTRKAEIKKGGEQFKERTDEQLQMLDAAASSGSNAFTSLPKDEKDAYLRNFGTDQRRRDKFKSNQEKSLLKTGRYSTDEAKIEAQRQHDLLFQRSDEFLSRDGKDLMDDAESDRFQDSRFANMHLLKNDIEREKAWDAQEKAGRLNLGLISAGALAAPASGAITTSTAAFLRSKVSRRDDKGRDITAFDDIVSHGKGTSQQRDALIGTIGAPDVSRVGTPDERKGSAQNVAALVNTSRIPKMGAGDKLLMDAMVDNLGAIGADLSPEIQGKATAQLIESGVYGSTPDAVRNVLKIPSSGYTPDILERIDNVIGSDASNTALFDHLVPAESSLPNNVSDPAVANEITKRVAGVSTSDIDSLYRTEPGASPKTILRKKQALSTIDRAVSAQLHVEDQKTQAAERLRKIREDIKAANTALTVAVANQTAAIAEKTAADAAVLGKTPANAAQHASIDQRAATAAAEATKATVFTTAAIAAQTKVSAPLPAAEKEVVRLGKENKRELKRLSDLHARIKNTASLGNRYIPAT
ncbi:MAG: hypothetical protein WCT28_01305 [Patescibacteria group bacterium]|jgi:hypothetical protein